MKCEKCGQRESWVPIRGYHGLYEISSVGRVKRLGQYRPHNHGRRAWHPAKIFSTKPQRRHHQLVTLTKNGCQRSWTVHRLVALHFIGPRPHGLVIDHADRDSHHNCALNLRYVTMAVNNRNVASLKLSAQKARKIKSLRSKGFPVIKIAAEFGISESHCYSVLAGEHWV